MLLSRWRAAILLTVLPVTLLLTAPEARSQTATFNAAETGGPEVLDYSVEWRLIPAGTAKLSWTPLPRSSGSAGEAKLHLESTGLVSRLFHVSDDYTASMGQNFCAQTSFMAAHEGFRNKETRVTFDTQARKANYVEKDLVKNSTATSVVDIPACVHDVLGGLMTLRTLHPEPGTTVQVPVTNGKKFAQVKIESERREELVTPLGKLKTVRYEVFVFENVIYQRSGHMHVWLTDDARHLPVQLQAQLRFAIGTITFRLEKAGL